MIAALDSFFLLTSGRLPHKKPKSKSSQFERSVGLTRLAGVLYQYITRERSIVMIEVVLNDRLGKKVRVKCNEDDTIGDLKKLAAAQLGTRSVV